MNKPFTRFIVQALRILLSAALLAGTAPVSPAVGQALPPASASEHAGAPRQVGWFPPQEDPPLAVAPDGVTVDGPATGEVGVSDPFIATVTPISATLPITYVWQASTQEPVTHAAVSSLTDTADLSWAAAGAQTVTVTASNAAGTVMATHTIDIAAAPPEPTVTPPPQADFTATPTTGPAPLAVTFTNASTGDYTTSEWDFGDGSPVSTEASPAHTYTASGSYTVTLTVSGSGGSDTEARASYITVTSGVQADFSATPLSGTAPLAVTFTNATTGDYTALSWDFGDGSPTSAEASPAHTYSAPGVYAVTLTASGPGGSDTESKASYITVYAPVAADFTATPTIGTAPLTVTFTNATSGDYTESLWDFGDGSPTSAEPSPTHVYAASGSYTVTLTASGPGGSDTESKAGYITVSSAIQADFSATPITGTAPLTVTFSNATSGDFTASEWDFGDGSPVSTEVSPTHTYTVGGSYTVTLTASGPGGSDTEAKASYIAVYAPVAADFSATPLSGTVPLEVAFTNLSTGDYTESAWDFGDGITSTLPSPTHTYTTPGSYTVTLTAVGLGGSDTEVRAGLITVEPAFSALTTSLPDLERGAVAWGDYDNDGDLDLLLAGRDSASTYARVYRNDDGTFADANAGLVGVRDGSVAWGDYDNDGDLDIVLTGNIIACEYNPADPMTLPCIPQRTARIYRNDGGTFVNIGAPLAAVDISSVAWGDYDNDGDLDLLLTGDTSVSPTTILYRNDGNGQFTDAGATLPGIDYSAVAWGDYDNDGDQDVLLAGYNDVEALSRVYRNDGNGQFTNINAGLEGVIWASVAWGDYDNDGDLDIALFGKNGPSGVRVAHVYRNDGNGQFMDINAGLAPASAGSLAWGDYDNDGDLDILQNCAEVSRVYRNDSGTFVDIAAGLPGVYYAGAAWGDHDNDGDLDIALTGYTGSGRLTRVYRNNADVANTLPGAPTGLSATVQECTITFNWQAATDDETPANGLTYNLRVSATPGGQNLLAPMAELGSGWRRLPQLGNANHGLTATLTIPSLAAGSTYYWSVQAVDAALAGGAFAQEGSFVVAATAPGQVAIDGPATGKTHLTNAFTATVSPAVTGLPLTYVWEAGEQGAVTHEGVASLSDNAAFSWSTAGTKWITVTVSNTLGAAVATRSIVLEVLPEFSDLGNRGMIDLERGIVAWGDYDNDGDLDLLLAGRNGLSTYARVYRNDNGAFVDANAGLTGFREGSAAWGDYDNDGDLDIVLTGNTVALDGWPFSPNRIARIYRNDGGTFVNINAGLTGVDLSSVAWGDYDNDGDLDLLLTGRTNTSPTTILYRNDGSGRFTSAGVALPGIEYSAVAWGDYDNDGDQDILLAGYDGAQAISRVYRNDGNGQFTNINAGLEGVLWATAAWGDYDNDSDLDILIGGRANTAGVRIAKVYRNDNGTFVDIQAGFPGASTGSVAWGDYDNDGDLDVLLAGKDSDAQGGTDHAQVYRNDSGIFTDIVAGLQGVEYASAAWGDYDNDGDLDIALTGYTGSAVITRIYRNNALLANTPPNAPAGLAASVQNQTAALSWNAATDAQTPATGLSYNLRVGTAPGGADVLGPMADGASGWRRLPKLGNAGQGTNARLKLPDVTPGKAYYWSVQALDTALTGGAFAAEGSFTVPLAPGQVTLAGPTTGAVNVAQAFTATVTPISATLPITYVWQASGQAPVTHAAMASLTDTASLTWGITGTQTVTVTATNAGGTVTGMHTLTLYAPPQAGFTATPLSGAPPLTVTFTNTTTGDYTGVLWDFGDGVTSTLQSPTHMYTIKGVYTVTLTVSGPGGTDTETKATYITVYTPVEAGFDAAPASGIAPLAVSFTNTTTGDYSELLWDFGDGVTSTLESPTHMYTIKGVYTVTLTASGPGGSDTEAKASYITIYALVVANFAGIPSSGPVPLEVAFSNMTAGDYVDSEWDFGDQVTSTLQSPTHVYSVPGVYTVTLTASGPGGTDTETKASYITAGTPVEAGFTAAPLSGIAPLTVTFTSTTTGDYTGLLWNLGDGVTSTLASLTHTYTVGGVYTVTLTASGPVGTDTVTKTNYVTVYAPVQAGFDAVPLSGMVPLTVTFTNTSTGDYTELLWNLGDGITSTLESLTHTYTVGGVYTVTLTANGPGGMDVITKTNYITVYAPVQTGFTAVPLAGMVPLTVTFSNTTTGSYTELLWDLGDGITSTLESLTHTYASPDLYTISLTASGPGGTATKVITDCITAFPVIPAPDPQRSDVVAQNVGGQAAAVRLSLAVGETEFSPKVPVRATRIVPSAELNTGTSSVWAGSGALHASQLLAPLVDLLWDDPLGPKTAATYAGYGAPATAAHLPRVAVDDGYLTRIIVHNTENAEAQVTLRVYDLNGTGRLEHNATIPANAERTFSLAELAPDLSATDGQGTAYITADKKIAAVATVHTYYTGEVYGGTATGDPLLWAPGVCRRQLADESWDYGEVVVQNAGIAPAGVYVEFINPDGSTAHTLEDSIAPLGAAAYNTRYQVALGSNWQGTVRVTSMNGQPLVGVVRQVAGAIADSLAHSAVAGSAASGKGLAFPAVYRQVSEASSARWSAATVQNTTATAGSVQVEFYGAGGARVGEAYTIALPAGGSVRLDLHEGGALPPAALEALGEDFVGSLIVTPTAGVEVTGVSHTFWGGEGRASGYAAFPLP